TQPKGSPPQGGRIIELTPELEVISSTRGKIIDLTHVLQTSGAPAATVVAPLAVPQTPPAPRSKISLSTKSGRHGSIEADVDAAFDFIQSKAAEIRGPRVEIEPTDLDIKVSVPAPIGDWDLDLSEDDLTTQAAKHLAERDLPQEEPELELAFDLEEKPATPAPTPAHENAPEVLPVPEAKAPTLEDLKADDTLDLTDIVKPIDLMPMADEPATQPQPPADEISQAQAPAAIMETAEAAPALAAAPTLAHPAAADEEEDLIELTDIVDPAELATTEEEEDVIELTDIVSPEELAAAGHTPPAAIEDEEEEIIELTDIVSPEELAAAGYTLPGGTEDEGEEVIELTDRVQPQLPLEDAAALAEDQEEIAVVPPPEHATSQTSAADDKDITELTQQVFAEREPQPEPVAEEMKPAGEQVIRLDSVLNHVRKNQSRIAEDITMGLEEELANEPLGSDEKDGGISIGMALNDVKETLGHTTPLTETEIEKAIEKVIRKKYSQAIERLLAAAVEKVVTREMESIKRSLMEDQEP
ncbi:MAG: hypothetical protein WAU91_11075, partial [Desulfatitalea sp.]